MHYWYSTGGLDKVNLYAIILLILTALTTFATMRTLGKEALLLEQQWQTHQNKVQKNLYRLSLLEDIRQHLGYGGIIHHFKNYILRQENAYLVHFDDSYDLLLDALETYEALPDLTAAEAEQLDVIKRVIGAYDKIRFFILEMMVLQGKSSEEIDAEVKIDDSFLLIAVEFLERRINLEFETLVLQERLKTKEILQKDRSFILMILLMLLVVTFVLVVLMSRHIHGAKQQL